MIKNIKHTLETPGDRLRAIRSYTSKSRKDFATHSTISEHTLRAWENETSPLTLKGAKRITQALHNEGILCTVNWLLYGKGVSPLMSPPYSSSPSAKALQNISSLEEMLDIDDETSILKEIALFQKNHKGSVIFMITDDGMKPFFNIGDYVGGIIVPPHKIDLLIGKPAIIKNEVGDTFVRLLLKGKKEGLYTLSCSNPLPNVEFPVLYDQKLNFVTKIIWHRQRLNLLSS